MTDIGNRIRMAFYSADDGPRIMLFGPLTADIASLQSFFRRLSKDTAEVRLDQEPFLVSFGGIELVARCSGSLMHQQTESISQGLRKPSSNRPHFVWTRSKEGWDYLAELIESMRFAKVPCHQYLTRYPDEDAIIVVSIGEYSDEVVSGCR